jgi:hypothetical protein
MNKSLIPISGCRILRIELPPALAGGEKGNDKKDGRALAKF